MPAAMSGPADAALRAAMSTWSGDSRQSEVAGAQLRGLAEAGLLELPLPAAGATAERFAALAVLGESDLTIARLAEAHADAVAILAELSGPELPAGATCGVWAAEPPAFPVQASEGDGGWSLRGTKAWCSGAGLYSHALVTAATDRGSRLFLVALDQPAVRPRDGGWETAALAGSDTRAVELVDAAAAPVGGVDDYVARPGFWHGAVGVAAVWYGGAVSIARTMSRAASKHSPDPIGLAHLGAIDVALAAARDSIAMAAASFDADPRDRGGRAAIVARRTRAVVEASATVVVDRVGRALGPLPMASDRRHAQQVADLQLYVRQSHADRDLADLGGRLLETGPDW